MNKRIVIIGGVAGGASAATRARRLDEFAEITVLEKGPYVSFANCGLPYHLGGVIKKREDLLLQTPQSLSERFALKVLVNHEAIWINRENHEVLVKNLLTSEEFTLGYDKLILSPGADPFIPPIPGVNFPNVFTLKTIPDLDAIVHHLSEHEVGHATVIGAGFIGLEAAENLRHRGINVAVVEREPQVMPPLDAEMASPVHEHLRLNGIELFLGSQAESIEHEGTKTKLRLANGHVINTDIIIMSIGVRPTVKLARDSGLELGERGGIKVNEHLQTSDPDILAVGDAIETADLVSGFKGIFALASPANRQGREAANTAMGHPASGYAGTLGTWICKVFDLAVAQTGNSEKTLKRLGIKYRKVYLHPNNHASYYPGASTLSLKLIFSEQTEEILGAQIVGRQGVDKRIDVLATAITARMKVTDLARLELAYAPPYGAARDPINQAGLIAQGVLSGLHPSLTPDELSSMDKSPYILVDVRTKVEHLAGHIPDSLHIPLNQLRAHLESLPKDKEIIVYCQVGLRGYVASRILLQRGFTVRNLLGGYKTWLMFNEKYLSDTPQNNLNTTQIATSESGEPSSEETQNEVSAKAGHTVQLDACGLQCPGPLLAMSSMMDELDVGQILEVTATDSGFPKDAESWCQRLGHNLLSSEYSAGRYVVRMEKANKIDNAASSHLGNSGVALSGLTKNRLTMVVFSNDLDRAYAAFIIANGATSMGMEVTLFFTFWGLNVLRTKEHPPINKTLVETMFGKMMPEGPDALGLSKMHFAGLGTAMMKNVMAQKNVSSLPELIQTAQRAGVKFIACTMSMDVMGIKKEELIPGVEEGGVATFIGSAGESAINLFV